MLAERDSSNARIQPTFGSRSTDGATTLIAHVRRGTLFIFNLSNVRLGVADITISRPPHVRSSRVVHLLELLYAHKGRIVFLFSSDTMTIVASYYEGACMSMVIDYRD